MTELEQKEKSESTDPTTMFSTIGSKISSFIIALILFCIIMIFSFWTHIVNYLARNAFEDEKVTRIQDAQQKLDLEQKLVENPTEAPENPKNPENLDSFLDIPSNFFKQIQHQSVQTIRATLGF